MYYVMFESVNVGIEILMWLSEKAVEIYETYLYQEYVFMSNVLKILSSLWLLGLRKYKNIFLRDAIFSSFFRTDNSMKVY